jgi:uncharacterized repeat protein (TIGR02543 family)
MATVRSSTSNHWRARCDYSTSQTDTTFTISANSGIESVSWGFDISNVYSDFCFMKSGESYTVISSGTSSFYSAYGASTYKAIASGSKTYDRGHSAYTVEVWGYVNNKSSYMTGQLWTSHGTVTVPAKTSYTVSYNANGGSNAPSSQTKWYNETLTLTSSTPTRTNYRFKGWSTSSSGSVNYASGASYTTNSALTLYAVWERITYTVSYNSNGGSGAPASQTKQAGTELTLSATIPTYPGRTFKGWATSSNGSVVYQPGGSYSADTSATLYAVWEIITYIVAFNANGGSGEPSDQTKTHGATLILSSTKPTRTGYTFQGWSASSTATSATYSAGGYYTKDEAVTLYAVWKINTWTVSYNANGGSNAPASQTKTYGQTLVLTESGPTRNNYKFVGWAKTSTGEVAYESGANYTEDADLTLYAVWELAANCYIKVNGSYVPGMMYRKNDGTYQTGYLYCRDNGTYKQSNIN